MLDLLEVASEPTRRRLIQLLGSGERTVTELTANFTVSRSAISQHLLLLTEVGLLAARKSGRCRFYALNPTGVARLKTQLESFWNTELELLVSDANHLAASKTPVVQPHKHTGEQQ